MISIKESNLCHPPARSLRRPFASRAARILGLSVCSPISTVSPLLRVHAIALRQMLGNYFCVILHTCKTSFPRYVVTYGKVLKLFCATSLRSCVEQLILVVRCGQHRTRIYLPADLLLVSIKSSELYGGYVSPPAPGVWQLADRLQHPHVRASIPTLAKSGTLVHYFENEAEIPGLPEAIPLPASSSGKRGYISVKALRLAARVRSTGTRLVLVSGTRYSTFADRLPYLPRADAYVIENGGRIFFPRKRLSESLGARGGGVGVEVSLPDEVASVIEDPELMAHPASALEEDLEWRKVMESVTGPAAQDSKNPEERKGALWDLYRKAVAEGFEVDTRTYYTMLRIKIKDRNDRKRIEEDKECRVGDDGDERDEVRGGQDRMKRLLDSLPPGLGVATNLGLVDIFSDKSGKHNAAAYLAKEHFKISLDNCASMGDDDNDITLVRKTLILEVSLLSTRVG